MLDILHRSRGRSASLNGALHDTGADMKALVRDAQTLLTAAASTGGERADDLRARATDLLGRALDGAGSYQDQAIGKGKELARTADVYAKDNPWRVAVAAAGVGLLLGMLLGRKD